jgi:thiol:disulfide interchange protein DsbC
MVREQPLSQVAANANCDTTALTRNVEFGHKHKIQGTPMLVFINGNRVPGALDTKQIEAQLSEASKG